MEFKKERSNHNTLLYNNSGRKQVIDKMIQHEIIGMADRLENVEKAMDDGKAEQVLSLKMIMNKLEEIQEH